MAARFTLGRIVATPGALEALEASGVSPVELLGRHQSGDWGEIPPEDARENERSVKHGFRILSSYPIGEERTWIITEADRSSTCLLLPSEY
ncbi:hypothetical protein [Rubrobacter aplysinae]|uniref:hypothetical protein n=1 Tax=Rubrobacter aplysinae TaxID=909625 RepID=UPI00064C22F1|nr:hypothetical protein [Rubrobacter aplysinae]